MFESNSPDKIASAYDEWSQTYEAVENPTRDLAAAALRLEMTAIDGRDGLEIGCGTGLNTKYLAERCRHLTAFDFSAGMLAKARANVTADKVRFLRQDIQTAWNVADNSVDFIACTLVLEHIENLEHIFGEAARVLLAGGDFFVYELHPFKQLQGSQARFTDAASGDTKLIPAYLHDVSDYISAASASGFELVRLVEWRDGVNAPKTDVPRLLSIQVRKR